MSKSKNSALDVLLGGIFEAERIELDDEDTEKEEYEAYLKNLLKEFLQKDSNTTRVKLLQDFQNGAPLTGENGLRKKLASFDMEFFGRAYLPHYFVRKSPKFHEELDNIWSDGVLKGNIPLTRAVRKKISRLKGCKRAIAAPRGHAKSTTLTFKGSLHATLYEYKHYIIILSDSSDQAESFLDAIKTELEENEHIIEDFGILEGNKAWRSNVLLTKSNIKIEAIGSGKKIRGRKHKNWRPDLLILDDIENDENVRTLEQRKKLSNWFYKAVSKAGDDYTDIVYIGTMLHYDSLLANVMKNPSYKAIKYKAVLSFSHSELWDEWETIYTDISNSNHEQDALDFFNDHKQEMLDGTEVLWEDKLSYYDLMTIKVSEGDGSFNSELQNDPINPEDCLFNPEWYDFYNELETIFNSKDYKFYGAVDPSLGKSNKSDYSAIITIAKHKVTGYMFVIDADIARRHPDKIINDILEKQKWLRLTYGVGYEKFGCETVQFQWFLKEELAKASARAGLYLPIEEINSTADKVLRIQSLQPDIKNKYIKFNPKHKLLLEQMSQFPMGSHDDGIDCLEMVRTIAKKGKRFRILDKSLFGI